MPKKERRFEKGDVVKVNKKHFRGLNFLIGPVKDATLIVVATRDTRRGQQVRFTLRDELSYTSGWIHSKALVPFK